MKKTLSPKKQKIRRFRNYGFLFFGLFGVTACSAYFMIPAKQAAISDSDDGGNSDSTSVDPLTPTQHFVNNLENITGLSATVNSFSATFANPLNTSSSTKADVTIALEKTSLALAIDGWPDVSLNLDTTIDYNGLSKPVHVSYVKASDDANARRNLYVSALGLKYKTTDENYANFFASLFTTFKLADIPSPDFSSMDTSSLTKLLDNMTSTALESGGYTFKLPLDDLAWTDSAKQYITMVSDKDYNLTSVSTTGISIKGCALKFDVGINTQAALDLTKFVPSDSASYLDIYNSWGVIEKVTNLIRNPSFGIGVDISVVKNITESSVTNTYQVANILGSANLNVTTNDYQGQLSVSAPKAQTLKSLASTLPDDKKTTQSLAADYVKSGDDANVYVSYNDGLKLQMKTSVANAIITKAKADFPAQDLSSVNKLFDFVTTSPAMKGLADGKFESVISMLDDFKIGDNTLEATLRLANLGLGSDSAVVVTLDGNQTKNTFAKVVIQNVVLKDYEIEKAAFTLQAYTAPSLVSSDYQSLNDSMTIYDQVVALAKDTTAAIDVKGAVMKYDTTALKDTGDGVSFTGSTEFDANQDTSKDANAKSGTGTATITQLKNNAEYQTHHIGIDVRGENDMLFRYTTGDPTSSDTKYLNGRFTIQTLNDIIGLIKELMNSTDTRYTKFFDPIKEQGATLVVGKIVAGDYEELIRNKILDSVSVTSDEIVVSIDKTLLSTDKAIELTLTRKDGKISGLNIANFVIDGMSIEGVKLTLGTYDAAQLKKLPEPGVVNYLQFSEIKVLLAFGITTSEQSYFHLTATASVGIGSLKLIKLTMDFHITVNGTEVKVVGKTTLPLVPFVNGTSPNYLFGGTRTVKFYYQTGYCYLNGYDDYGLSFLNSSDSIKVVDTNFASNFLHYFLNNILQMTSKIQNQITTSSSASASKPIAFEQVLTAFTYDNSTGSPTWDMTINTGVLANDSKLGNLVLHIVGTDDDATDNVVDGHLTTLTANWSITAGLKITVDLTANLANPGSTANEFPSDILSDYNTYMSDHASQTLTSI